jgi:hypothetical protein
MPKEVDGFVIAPGSAVTCVDGFRAVKGDGELPMEPLRLRKLY